MHVLVGLVVLLDLLEGVHAKVLLLDAHELANVVLKLAVLQLLQVVLATNHMLDQLGDFLVEFDYIWFFMHKINNLPPFKKHGVSVHFLLTPSETAYHFAQHLTRAHGLWLWLLDPE